MSVQLPNGDMWNPPSGQERPDTASAAPAPQPEAPHEAAIAAAQADPLRPSILCPWCAQEFPNEDDFSRHVRSMHANALGLSAEDARDMEARHVMRQRAERRAEPTAETVIADTMNAVAPDPSDSAQK